MESLAPKQDNDKPVTKPLLSVDDEMMRLLYIVLVFLVIVNPMTYKLVNALLGRFVKIAGSDGCPTTAGMLVHASVFALLLKFLKL